MLEKKPLQGDDWAVASLLAVRLYYAEDYMYSYSGGQPLPCELNFFLDAANRAAGDATRGARPGRDSLGVRGTRQLWEPVLSRPG
jgi:hypothetical protein